MYDKVSLVDGFSLWLSSRTLFRKSTVLFCKLLLCLEQTSGGGWQKSLKRHPLWKEARPQTLLCDYQILGITDSHLNGEVLIIFMNYFQQE